MRRLFLSFLSVAALCAPAWAADWIPLQKGASPGTPPTVRTLSCDTSGTVLEVSIPGFWAEKTPWGWKLRLPGGLVTMKEGRPELPFLGCTLAMPSPDKPSLSVVSAHFLLPGVFKVRMAPKPELEGQVNTPPPPSAPGIPFPPNPLKVAHRGLWRTLPLASLQVHPFKAKGDGTLLGAADRMVVRVSFTNPPAAWPARDLPEEFLPAAKATLVNFGSIPLNSTPPASPMASTTEYLVVANASLASGVTSLINWRKRQGYKTELVTTTSTNPTTIKGYIQSRFSGGHLKYVVLVGDYAQIPWYVWSGDRSDMWYACLTGGSTPDLYPDVALGRLSGTSASQIAHQAAKILKYEQNPPSGNWFTKTILAAHRQGAPGKYVGCSEQIANGPLKTSGWTIIKQYGNNSSVSNTTVSNYINAGVGLVNYRGHGSTTEWANGWNTHSGGYSTSIVNALHNGDMTPIVFNIACYNGNFQAGTCLQEAWMRAADAAVASLGATQPSYTIPNHEFDKELYRAIFQDKLTNIYDFWYKGVVKLISQGTYGKHNARMYWWAGDGRTNLWSKAPSNMVVTHPSSISTGPHQVTVKAIPLARVCLYKGSEVFAVGVCSLFTGKAVFNVNPTTTGAILVTVTDNYRRPYLGSITVTSGGTVIPDGLEKTEGSTARHIPSRYAPNRCQHLYDASILKGLKSGYIKALWMRRDGKLSTAFQTHNYLFDVHVSSFGVKSAAYWNHSSYKANRGPDYTHVLAKTLVSFPATPKPAAPPAPFTAKVPFVRPFRYTQGRNLLVQFDVAPSSGSSANYFWYADAQYYSSSGTGHSAVKYGKGCPPGKVLYGYAPPVNGTSRLYWYWYSGGGYSTPAMAVLGVSRTSFMGFPLPFSLSGIGAPGCYLNCDIAAAFPGLTDPSGTNGRYRVDLPVPYSPIFAGARVYGQTLVFKKGFNNAGLMASEGLQFTLGAYVKPAPALQLYTYGVTPPFSDKPRFAFNCGLVLKVEM